MIGYSKLIKKGKYITLIDKVFDYGTNIGGSKLIVKYGEIYDYESYSDWSHLICVRSIKYPILEMFFSDVFIDLSDHRDNKLIKLDI